jgi:uncharacterized protein (DUF2336 family)
MESPQSSDGSTMDPLLAIGPSLPALRAAALPSRAVEPSPFASDPSTAGSISPAELEAALRGDPATQKQATLHLMSHIDADCFISLLQTVDPMPYDYRARDEYKRFYRGLHDSLVIPLPPADPLPGR